MKAIDLAASAARRLGWEPAVGELVWYREFSDTGATTWRHGTVRDLPPADPLYPHALTYTIVGARARVQVPLSRLAPRLA